MINTEPSLKGAMEALANIQRMITDEMIQDIENSSHVASMLEIRMYVDMIHEWLECSDDIEAKKAEDVIAEIYDGWRYYGD